jgi:hypothetical protein
MLRGYDPARTLEFCSTCHIETQAWRVNPHRAGDADSDTCLLCHRDRLEVTSAGIRRFDPRLYDSSSAGCLGCHRPHWDYASEGHVDRTVTDKVYARMASFAGKATGRDGADWGPRVLPLNDRQITCYTCHNPHPPALFDPASDLGRRATTAADAKVRLRMPQMDLCWTCHGG